MKKKIKDGWLPGFVKFAKSDVGRKQLSDLKKDYFRKHPEKHPNRLLANNRNNMSYPERLIYDELTLLGISFEHNKSISGYFPDFVIDNYIIEIDGEYWHNQEYDDAKDKILKSLGYIVKRFPVGNKKDLIERVLTYLNDINICITETKIK